LNGLTFIKKETKKKWHAMVHKMKNKHTLTFVFFPSYMQRNLQAFLVSIVGSVHVGFSVGSPKLVRFSSVALL